MRAGAVRCPAHSTAALKVGAPDQSAGFLEETETGALATTATFDPGSDAAMPGPVASARRSPLDGLRRAARAARTPVLVVLAIIGFNLAFPLVVANKRPTVLRQSGAAPASLAIPPRSPTPGLVPAWDPVDVELFMGSCAESEPAEVCQCQVEAVQPYYSGEQALAYADRQGRDRALLPQRYRDVLVRCSQGY